MEPTASPCFEQEHRRLDTQLRAHLIDVVSTDFESAFERLRQWHAALVRHVEVEETALLPHIPAGARWDARLYHLEHERILLLAREYATKVRTVAAQPPVEARARCEAALTLLDEAHSLRHVLEHHHQREEMALAHELPAALQEAAWAEGGIGSAGAGETGGARTG